MMCSIYMQRRCDLTPSLEQLIEILMLMIVYHGYGFCALILCINLTTYVHNPTIFFLKVTFL